MYTDNYYMFTPPKSKLKHGPKIENIWKIYPSSMGAVMGLSPYKHPNKAIAELWEYGAKDFFKSAIVEKFGDKAITTKQYVARLMREDSELSKYIRWSVGAKSNEYWKRQLNLGSKDKPGKIKERLNQIFPDNPFAADLAMNQIRGHIFMRSGTYGETNALEMANENVEDTIDYWSKQMLEPYKIKSNEKFGGIITAEVDGWLKKGKARPTKRVKRQKPSGFYGIVEHKQRQGDPKYPLPTKDKKPEEMVQMNIYMHITNTDRCLWVQTNKFKSEAKVKQSYTMISKNDTLIQNIQEHCVKTLKTLNRLYDDKKLRYELLDASYDSKKNIIWPFSTESTENGKK